MAGPVFDGAVQVTNRLVVLPATEDTEGAAGRPGGVEDVGVGHGGRGHERGCRCQAASETASTASATVMCRGRGGQGRRQGEFDLGCSRARRGRRRGDAVGLDGDVAMTDRADVLAEHQQHRLAVGRRRRRIAAGGDKRRADAVDLVPGVDQRPWCGRDRR